jgi:hypothetical protein
MSISTSPSTRTSREQQQNRELRWLLIAAVLLLFLLTCCASGIVIEALRPNNQATDLNLLSPDQADYSPWKVLLQIAAVPDNIPGVIAAERITATAFALTPTATPPSVLASIPTLPSVPEPPGGGLVPTPISVIVIETPTVTPRPIQSTPIPVISTAVAEIPTATPSGAVDTATPQLASATPTPTRDNPGVESDTPTATPTSPNANATATATSVVAATSTATSVAVPTNTLVVPTRTPTLVATPIVTATLAEPTATASLPPTNTATNTPTNTRRPADTPTSTATTVPPTATTVPTPTNSATTVPPTDTPTSTATSTTVTGNITGSGSFSQPPVLNQASDFILTITNSSGAPVTITEISIDVRQGINPSTFLLVPPCSDGSCSQDVLGGYVITWTGSVVVNSASSTSITFPGGFALGTTGDASFDISFTSTPAIPSFTHNFTIS